MQQVLSAALRYLLHVPAGAPDGPLPLVLFLHGSGERGSDPQLVKKYGLPHEVEDRPDFPLVVVSPQCPADVRWTELGDEVMSVLDTVQSHLDIDRHHRYLTGFSMGGQGTWHLAVEHADVFAAIAPVAGRIPPAPGFLDRLCRLAATPVWVAHSEADTAVPIESTETMVERLRACGGDVRVTRYTDLDHGQSADLFFQGDTLADWFLSHRR
jgi:predicted peptidase